MPNSHSNSVMEVTLSSVVKTLLQNSCYRGQQPQSSQKSSGTWEDFCYQVEVREVKLVVKIFIFNIHFLEGTPKRSEKCIVEYILQSGISFISSLAIVLMFSPQGVVWVITAAGGWGRDLSWPCLQDCQRAGLSGRGGALWGEGRNYCCPVQFRPSFSGQDQGWPQHCLHLPAQSYHPPSYWPQAWL